MVNHIVRFSPIPAPPRLYSLTEIAPSDSQ
jgi:hypothetical protein